MFLSYLKFVESRSNNYFSIFIPLQSPFKHPTSMYSYTIFTSLGIDIELFSGLLSAMSFQPPTSPFPMLEPPNPWIGEFYVVQERRETDFKARKLKKKIQSGSM